MHYKRLRKYGTTSYRWGNRIPGRPCLHCKRPVEARDLCSRHYQMLRRHGDPLYSDKNRKSDSEPGSHILGGYKIISPAALMNVGAQIPDATVERTSRYATKKEKRNARPGKPNKDRKVYEHRKITGAKPGQIVHHINGKKYENSEGNLHVFNTRSEHVLAHRSLEAIAFALVDDGAITFNRETGTYELSSRLSKKQ